MQKFLGPACLGSPQPVGGEQRAGEESSTFTALTPMNGDGCDEWKWTTRVVWPWSSPTRKSKKHVLTIGILLQDAPSPSCWLYQYILLWQIRDENFLDSELLNEFWCLIVLGEGLPPPDQRVGSAALQYFERCWNPVWAFPQTRMTSSLHTGKFPNLSPFSTLQTCHRRTPGWVVAGSNVW